MLVLKRRGYEKIPSRLEDCRKLNGTKKVERNLCAPLATSRALGQCSKENTMSWNGRNVANFASRVNELREYLKSHTDLDVKLDCSLYTATYMCMYRVSSV